MLIKNAMRQRNPGKEGQRSCINQLHVTIMKGLSQHPFFAPAVQTP